MVLIPTCVISGKFPESRIGKKILFSQRAILRNLPIFSTKKTDFQEFVCETMVDIGHTALGGMVETKKKELVLVAMNMSNDEFKVLHQEQERRLNSLAQTDDVLAADLEITSNATTEATGRSD